MAKEDVKQCDECLVAYGDTFRPAPGALTLETLRAACVRYADQLSIQALDLSRIRHLLDRLGLWEGAATSAFGSYQRPDEMVSSANRDPFEVDPQIVERGLRGHARTQNALAVFLETHGFVPKSPGVGQPESDLAWLAGLTVFVAEVKSVSDDNEEKQLRLGLGQILRYRHLLALEHNAVQAVLVLEREPRDKTWEAICLEHGVSLVWPARFDMLLLVNRGGLEDDLTILPVTDKASAGQS